MKKIKLDGREIEVLNIELNGLENLENLRPESLYENLSSIRLSIECYKIWSYLSLSIPDAGVHDFEWHLNLGKRRVTARAVPISFPVGLLFDAKYSDAEPQIILEVRYLRLDISGKIYMELDSAAHVYKVNDVDYLEEVRRKRSDSREA